LEGGGEVGVGEALVGDGADEAVDAVGADGGEEAVGGGGVGAAVVHGGAGFDAGAEAVEDNAADFAFEDADEGSEVFEVLPGAVEGGGELAFEAVGEAEEGVEVGALGDDGAGTEDFALEFLVLFDDFEGGFEDAAGGLGCVVVGCGGGLADFLEAGDGVPNGGAGLVGFGDAAMEHAGWRDVFDEVAGFDGEGFEVLAFEAEEDGGVGAELADAHVDGGDIGFGDFFGAFFEGAGEEEDGVDGAHLGVNGDGVGAGVGGVEEGASAAQGAGEGDGLGEGVFGEGEADVVAATVEEGEGAGGEAVFEEGGVDGAGEEFAGAGMGGVAFDDDGATGGEGADGVSADDADGEGEVGGAEDDDGAEGDVDFADVGFGDGLAVGLGAVDGGLQPGAFAEEVGEHFALVHGAAALAGEAGHGEGGFLMGAFEEGIAEGEDFFGEGVEEGGAGFGGSEAEGVEGSVGGEEGVVGEFSGGIAEGGREGFAFSGVGGLEKVASGGDFGACDEMVSGELHGGWEWVEVISDQ
jgi:hypothetical protein